MSLFDVIKYSGTNIRREEELRKLPKELFNLYWKNLGSTWQGTVDQRWAAATTAKLSYERCYRIFTDTLEEYDTE